MSDRFVGPGSDDMLFGRVREVVKSGTSVIYITHRLAELRQIAHRVTVLRDGRWRGSSLVRDMQRCRVACPYRRPHAGFGLSTQGGGDAKGNKLRRFRSHGRGFRDISFDVPRGQIIGIAGVEGNGQSHLIVALAGLLPSQGTATVHGRTVQNSELLGKAAYMPSDRHAEGLASG